MGPAAQIHPLALLVDSDLLITRQVFNDLHLVVLTHIAKNFDRPVAGADDALNSQIVGGDLGHALFNGLEVFRREVVARRKVVIKTVLNGRSDSDLRAREELLYRLRQQVSGGVTNNFYGRLIAIRENTERGVALNHIGGIDLSAVNHTSECGFRETRANIGGDIKHCDRGIKSALGSIREGNNRHEALLMQWRPLPEAA